MGLCVREMGGAEGGGAGGRGEGVRWGQDASASRGGCHSWQHDSSFVFDPQAIGNEEFQ